MNYFSRTFRRRSLDALQQKFSHYYTGVVLDIGGRDRGQFKKPKDKVEKWIFADIESAHEPDMVLDVADMNAVADESIDVVNAMELFEHVLHIEKGLDECVRVLRNGGYVMISVPFLYPIHADPHDYQRWTLEKWTIELEKRGIQLEEGIVTGLFFSVMGDMWKVFVRSLPLLLRYVGYLTWPVVDLLAMLDSTSFVQGQARLSRFHHGYFLVGKK